MELLAQSSIAQLVPRLLSHLVQFRQIPRQPSQLVALPQFVLGLQLPAKFVPKHFLLTKHHDAEPHLD